LLGGVIVIQIIPLFEPTNNATNAEKPTQKPKHSIGPIVWAANQQKQTDIASNQTQRSDKNYLEKSTAQPFDHPSICHIGLSKKADLSRRCEAKTEPPPTRGVNRAGRADLSRRSLTQAEVKRRRNSGTASANGGVVYPHIRLNLVYIHINQVVATV